MTIDLLYDIANDLLGAAADVLAEAGQAAPERRMVDLGDPPMAPLGDGNDCQSQLACSILGPNVATAPQLGGITSVQSARGSCAHIWSATFVLTLYRCHEPAADVLPAPHEIHAAGREHLRDGWQLARGMAYRWGKGTLIPSLGADEPCSVINIMDMRSIGPTGGIRGWRLPIRTLLDGRYDPNTGI